MACQAIHLPDFRYHDEADTRFGRLDIHKLFLVATILTLPIYAKNPDIVKEKVILYGWFDEHEIVDDLVPDN